VELLADAALWQRIADHHIGPRDASLSFVGRLARENRWDMAYAERVIGEYRRFCYLASTAGREVTPSDAVDQAWHLHLTYSRDYWQVFCPQVLRAELHHGPTEGGPAERTRFYRQYSETLAAYENAFGSAPPADIWPAAHRRFSVDPRGIRVNPSYVIILRRRVALALSLLLIAGGWLAGRMI
jgi:hypothetical protein